MRQKPLLLIWLAILALFSVTVSAQDSEAIYPSQYSTLEDYVAATGDVIDTFGEAPMLAERVEAGELPSVEERLPVQPAVVVPLESVGVYGGELVGPSLNATCCGWDIIQMRLQKLFTIDTDLTTIIPNIAQAYDVNEDSTVYTIYLREGHRWSDGTPFTAEDFRFFYEDVLLNEDLTPVPAGSWVVDGEPALFEVIDETTVRYTFAQPNPSFIVALATEVYDRGYRPAHYFQQYHLDYNENANDLASEQGFDDWVQMFQSKMQPYNFTWDLGSESDAYAPTLNAYVFVGEDSFGNKSYERNPYFFKVDIEGNQLPYVDTLHRVLVEDLEVQDLRAIAGEYTHHGWARLSSFPTYRENEESGGYRTALIGYERGNEYAFAFNYTVEDPVLREIFWDIRFRQAMSVAINRQEINDLVYFGLATPSQAVPTPNSAFYEDWMTDYYAQYDPDLANQLLDEMGLDQRDADGFRLRPDGETLFINMQVENAWPEIVELVTSYWNEVGVKTNLRFIDAGLYTELRDGNQVDVGGWALDSVDITDFAEGYTRWVADWGPLSVGVPWQQWLENDGTMGEEPPQEIIELYELSRDILAVPYGSEEYFELGQEFYTSAVEPLYMIGTIQSPPQPLLFDVNLRNTPPNDTQGAWSWSYRQWVQFLPEQWYFEPES